MNKGGKLEQQHILDEPGALLEWFGISLSMNPLRLSAPTPDSGDTVSKLMSSKTCLGSWVSEDHYKLNEFI